MANLTPEEQDALLQETRDLAEKVAKLEKPGAAKAAVGNFGSFLGKVPRSFLAAITSPEAVKAEKSLLVLVVTRLLLAAGATTGLVELITKVSGA